MAKATKNGAKFEKFMTREGMLYVCSKGDYDIELFPYQIDGETYYLGTLCGYARPLLSIEGTSATYTLGRLVKLAKRTAWTDANFFDDVVFPMSKDLNDWVKRPDRETYNSR